MEAGRTETLRHELAHAIRTGPFAAVLHLAFEESGISLEEARLRLAARGVHVATSTLSYWRRGRSRPERPDSLRGVALLEGILGLPADALTAQLGRRRPRGRWLDHPAGVLDPATGWGDRPEIDDLLRDVSHSGVTRRSVHDLYTVGKDREELALTTRQVVVADTDGVSRVAAMYHMYRDLPEPPTLRAVRGCRIGRIRADLDAGFLVGELTLDRVLRAGESAVIEHEVSGLFPREETDFYHRLFLAPIGEYVLQIQFDPAALPARCWRYERRRETAPDQGVREVWVGATGVAHLTAFGVPAGIVGIRWEWV